MIISPEEASLRCRLFNLSRIMRVRLAPKWDEFFARMMAIDASSPEAITDFVREDEEDPWCALTIALHDRAAEVMANYDNLVKVVASK